MIKIKSLTKSFENKVIINSFSCEIPDSGITVVRGESGRGKTTLARILAGLEKPDSGTVEGIKDQKISFMFQEDRLFPHLTAKENISIVSNEKTADELLEIFGLSADADKKPSELSGGMSRRIALARAIAFGGDLLILDEPFKGLDAKTKETIFAEVKQYSKSFPVLLISHDDDDFQKAEKIIDM